MEILEEIPVNLDTEDIKKKLHMEGRSEWHSVQRLAEEAQSLIRARAVYRVCYIESKPQDGIVIEGKLFKSRVLRRNLEDVGRVFPYVVTIGNEIEDRGKECKDVLEQYYLDTIGNVALSAARRYLEEQLKSKFALDGMSLMSPGSLRDWGIKEQRPLANRVDQGRPFLTFPELTDASGHRPGRLSLLSVLTYLHTRE